MIYFAILGLVMVLAAGVRGGQEAHVLQAPFSPRHWTLTGNASARAGASALACSAGGCVRVSFVC